MNSRNIVAIIFLLLPVWAANSQYGGFLGGVYSCFSSFKGLRAGYDKNLAKEIISGQVNQKFGCAGKGVLMTTARLIDKSRDCAKTAVMIRNEYLLSHGKSRVRKLSGVSTKNIEKGYEGVGRVLRYKKVDLSRDDDPAFMNMQAGDILHFDNVNCPKRSNIFLGHTMTIMSVGRDSAGRPKTVKVLEGHTRGHAPTFRKLKVSALLGNGRYKGFSLLGPWRNPIRDLSCTAFRGIATWKAEPRRQKVASGAAHRRRVNPRGGRQ